MRLSGGNETEIFGYDFLDRLTSVSGAYAESYSYNQIGNMLTRNGVSYTYPTSGVRPHAVSSVGSTSYVYDNNGNMTTRGSQTITWDVENRPLTVTGGASFVYDGDGNRVKKTEGGQTVTPVFLWEGLIRRGDYISEQGHNQDNGQGFIQLRFVTGRVRSLLPQSTESDGCSEKPPCLQQTLLFQVIEDVQIWWHNEL
jgi:hypothetical protein